MWSRRSRSGSQDADTEALLFEVVGMHCSSCGISIDEAVEELPVVAQSQTSVRSGEARVHLVADADREAATSAVRQAIAAAGYTATRRG